jgi:shikimate kinase
MTMNLVMLGYRGTGKSVLSKILARKLKRKLYRIDDLIAESAGFPVPRIVEKWGWPRFREIESQVVREVSESARNGIIDCGGGVVLDDANIESLKRGGKAILLTADFHTVLKRIRGDKNRPPLKDGVSFEEEQRQILAEREEKYRAAADLVVDTTHKSPEQTASDIIESCKKKSWI